LQQKTGKNLLKFGSVKQQDVKTNIGYVVNFKSERFLLIDTSAKSYNLNLLDLTSDSWLFLSSVGPNYEDFFKQLLELKKEKGFKLAYNPSSNELKNDVTTYIEMIKASDVLFVNKKEAKKIMVQWLNGSMVDNKISSAVNSLNNPPNSSPNDIRTNPLEIPASPAGRRMNPSPEMQKLLQEIYKINKGIVVITDGVRGSWAYDGKQIYYENSSGEIAKEKTGAGDAYESGFLAEFLKTGDIQFAMKNGTANAASVIKYVGAIEGLLYKM
jgi:sugar/nucleoside kinase (ribokinase family)